MIHPPCQMRAYGLEVSIFPKIYSLAEVIPHIIKFAPILIAINRVAPIMCEQRAHAGRFFKTKTFAAIIEFDQGFAAWSVFALCHGKEALALITIERFQPSATKNGRCKIDGCARKASPLSSSAATILIRTVDPPVKGSPSTKR